MITGTIGTKGIIAIANTVREGQPNNHTNKKVILQNCAPFTKCISRINNTQVDDAHDIDVVIPIYNLIEYSDNYLKKSGILWQYSRVEPALADDTIADFTADNANTNSFKIKQKTTGQTGKNGTKNKTIMIPLTYLSNFWRTLKISLINFEINLDLN